MTMIPTTLPTDPDKWTDVKQGEGWYLATQETFGYVWIEIVFDGKVPDCNGLMVRGLKRTTVPYQIFMDEDTVIVQVLKSSFTIQMESIGLAAIFRDSQ